MNNQTSVQHSPHPICPTLEWMVNCNNNPYGWYKTQEQAEQEASELRQYRAN